MYQPEEKKFLELTKKGNLIPVYKEILGDLETPVSAYLKLTSNSKYSFLLESVEGEEKVARFSFLAKDPKFIFESKNNIINLKKINKGKIVHSIQAKTADNPLIFIRKLLSKYKFVNLNGLPIFCGGMVGYLSYDMARFFEKIPDISQDKLNLPDALFVLAKTFVIFDHLNHKIKIVNCTYVNPKSTKKAKLEAYRKAHNNIEAIIKELNKPLSINENKNGLESPSPIKLKIKSNFTEAQFKAVVNKAKKKIQSGDIIQVVLSQRFEIDISTDPFNIYRALRGLNPSPYMYYLNFNDLKIIGASPELLVRCEDKVVETRPIAGTRKRGKTEKEDTFLKNDLLSDPKEKAEHIMLVDLGRNDLGRVCKKGSVKVSEFMGIEKYSHVMHIVSNVKGDLKQSMDSIDVLQAAFPAGTVSGAPKIRAMEIIEELENVKRGPYAGCVGYFSFSGNLDTCITIRTIVTKNNKAYIQVGAGIVADSNPRKEYIETLNKSKAQIMAVQMAHTKY